MLRLLVLLLVLANAAYYAWSHGLLADWGAGPPPQSEPQRLADQVRPEAVRVLATDEVRRLESGAAAGSRTTECLVAGLFTEAETETLRQALAGWPAGSWSLEPGTETARWIVYMGRYPSPQDVDRKRAELRAMGVGFEPLLNASLEPGLSLGGHATEAAARQQLEALAARGVRTGRVVQERADARGLTLRLPAVDEPLRPRLDELRPALNGKALRACR